MPDLGAPQSKGISPLDLMLAAVIMSLLAVVAIPAYDQFMIREKNAKAIWDIDLMSVEIDRFQLRNDGQLHDSLTQLPMEVPLDPWGAPYQYLNIIDAAAGKDAFRKNGKLNQLNTDYDLYSMGADGFSTEPLSAKDSRDDIVRANNGAYIGLGEDY